MLINQVVTGIPIEMGVPIYPEAEVIKEEGVKTEEVKDSKFSYVEAFAKGGYTFDETSSTLDKMRVVGMWILSFICPLFPAITFFAFWIKDTLVMLKPAVEVAPPPANVEEEVNLDDMGDEEEEEIDSSEPADGEKEIEKKKRFFGCSPANGDENSEEGIITRIDPTVMLTTTSIGQSIIDSELPASLEKQDETFPPQMAAASYVPTMTQSNPSANDIIVQPLLDESRSSNEPTILPPLRERQEVEPQHVAIAATVVPAQSRRAQDVFDKGDLLATVRKGKHLPDITRMMMAFAKDWDPSWVQNPGQPGDKLRVLSMFETLAGILSTKENIGYLTAAANGLTANLILDALAKQMTDAKKEMSPQEWQRQVSAFERFTRVPVGTFAQHGNCRKLLDAVVQDPWKLFNGIQQSLKAIKEARSHA